MRRFSSGIIGIVAGAAAFGAALHFEQASGSRATAAALALLQEAGPAQTFTLPAHDVNRAAKADRAAAPTAAVGYRTVMLSVVDLPATSVAIRMPSAVAPPAPAPRSVPKPDGASGISLVACEPVASILTDAGRSGIIGRCLT